MTQKTDMESIECYVGSGNVFADLELPNPEELQLKASLSIEIEAAIKKKRLTKKQAALHLGLSQEELAAVIGDGFSDFPLGQLVSYLNCLGHDVTLTASVRESVINTKKPVRREEQKAAVA